MKNDRLLTFVKPFINIKFIINVKSINYSQKKKFNNINHIFIVVKKKKNKK